MTRKQWGRDAIYASRKEGDLWWKGLDLSRRLGQRSQRGGKTTVDVKEMSLVQGGKDTSPTAYHKKYKEETRGQAHGNS